MSTFRDDAIKTLAEVKAYERKLTIAGKVTTVRHKNCIISFTGKRENCRFVDYLDNPPPVVGYPLQR